MAIMTPVDHLVRYYPGYWYLASPYSHPDDEVRIGRYAAVRRASGQLMKRGLFLMSPIVLCHEAALETNLPTDFSFWWDFNACFMNRSCGMLLLRLDGWQHSKGVQAELDFYIHNGKPIFALDDGLSENAEVIFSAHHAATLR